MNRPYDIMVAGHLCLDIIPEFPGVCARKIEDILRPGTLVNVGDAVLSTGGSVSNTGICMNTLGNRVCFCARVGDDPFGRLTLDVLGRNGNVEGVKIVPGTASSYTVVIALPQIDRIFLHNPGTNDMFGPEDIDPDLVCQCRHFHFGYPTLMHRMFQNDGSELQEIFRIAKSAGATTSCDMTLPDPDSPSGKVDWLSILERVLPYVDIFLPSVEEMLFMMDPDAFMSVNEGYKGADLLDHIEPDEYGRIADRILSMGAKMVSLKSGHRGVYIRTGATRTFEDMGEVCPVSLDNWTGRELWQQAFEARGHGGSATGSGDSAIAGFLTAFLRGMSIEAALQYAVCCGMQNLSALDAVSGVQSWDKTTALIDADLPLVDAHIQSDQWTPAAQRGLWTGPHDNVRSHVW